MGDESPREGGPDPNLEARLRADFERAGQGHVFRFWDDLDRRERSDFLWQLASIDLSLCDKLPDIPGRDDRLAPDVEIGALPTVPLPRTEADRDRLAEARCAGEAALRSGRVGAFLAAGGQGSRLGFEGPKGTYPIGPVTDRSLFRLFAETVLAHARRWGAPVPLMVMTSPENHEETVAFFRKRRNFGLPEEHLRFASQGMFPSLTEEGKILLRSKGKVFLSPDGHGGALKVIASGGGLEWFRSRGVDTLFYFQVDNPLLPVLDPPFLGHHLLSGSRFTTKVARKTGPEERMGVFANVDGRLRVVEYIHLPQNLARTRDGEDRLLFWAGNVAVHAIDLPFVAGLGRDFALPLHAARKPECGIDEEGRPLDHGTPMVIKLETFIFDAIPLAKKALVVEVAREEEFGPVKSPEGADTPENARRMMTAKAARWLETAGAKIPREPRGEPAHPIEISPLTALVPEDLEALVKKGLALEGPLVL